MQRRVIALLSSLLGLTVSVHDEQLSIRIPCQAKVEPGLQYRKISWYKVKEESDGLIGLVIKDLHTHETVLYKFANQSYEVGDDYSLLLPEFSEKDCGHYRCTLWPPLDHYIQDGDYEFYQFGCSKPPLQSKTVTGEKTRTSVNNIPLFLIISGVLAFANVVIIYLSWRRITWNKKAKQVYFCESLKRDSVNCSDDISKSCSV
uniref:Ig-like domain-containing protein n=1 Tax=Pygocentrus nattereri TaxID=42514 RepID=A0AAR2JN06_PYGNA